MKEIKIKAYRITTTRRNLSVIISAKSKEEALEIFNNWIIYKGHDFSIEAIMQVRGDRYAQFMSSDYYTAQCIYMEKLKRNYKEKKQ